MKINKDQAGFSKWKDIGFSCRRGEGRLAPYLINRFRWHWYPRLRYVSKFPDHIDVEISSACNMRCPMCYTVTDEFKKSVNNNLMDMGLFKKIIDECAGYGAYSIRISLRGEPFIHKDAIAMIRYAKDKGIKEVSSLTNNLALTPALFREAMEAGLDWLTISFDGLGGTYEQIRRPAVFKESYEKIKEYKRIKDESCSRRPLIKVQTVWPAIRDCARAYFDAFDPYADAIAINPLVDYLHRDTDIIYTDKFVCPVLYQRMVIGSDGIALLCSNDEFCLHSIGDANKELLYDIWHGEKLAKARQIHNTYQGVELLEPCRRCYLPRKTKAVSERFGDKEIKIDKYINRPDYIGE